MRNVIDERIFVISRVSWRPPDRWLGLNTSQRGHRTRSRGWFTWQSVLLRTLANTKCPLFFFYSFSLERARLARVRGEQGDHGYHQWPHYIFCPGSLTNDRLVTRQPWQDLVHRPERPMRPFACLSYWQPRGRGFRSKPFVA